MVEIFKNFNITKSNAKQKTYLATIVAVTSGTLMFTAWQFIVPVDKDLPEANLAIIISLVIVSTLLLAWGYNIYEEKQE